jgi:hypothetical protein
MKKHNESETKKESLLPEMISTLINQGKIKMKIYPSKGKIYGVTVPEDEDILRKELSKKYEKIMRNANK